MHIMPYAVLQRCAAVSSAYTLTRNRCVRDGPVHDNVWPQALVRPDGRPRLTVDGLG
jgi:hypothetical protein